MVSGTDRYCWIVLLIAALGGSLTRMDQNLMNLVRVRRSMSCFIKRLPPRNFRLSKRPTSKSTAATSLDISPRLGAGGFVFGIVGDRLGRTRTMMLTILIYAIFTGEAACPFI